MNTWWKSFEKHPKLYWVISGIWLIIISYFGFLVNLGKIGLVDKTEGLYVEVAHQIVLTNNWIVPYWNGEYFFSYPIGGYWFIALSFKLFGVSEWAARLPSALSAIAFLVLAFYTLRYFGGTENSDSSKKGNLWLRAWLGVGILGLNPGWVVWGRAGVSDMFLASAMGIALLAFFLGYAQPQKPQVQKRWYLAVAVFSAIAVLVKGPIGILLPVLTIVGFLLYVRKFQEVWREMPLLSMIVIFLLLSVPWYAAVSLATGKDFINEFFGVSNFQRFTSVVFRHPGPWYYYIPCLLILLLPWSVYLPVAIAHLRFWQRSSWCNASRSTHLGLFAWFWLAIMFVFFSAAQTKLPGYILPLIPAGGIILTLFWSHQLQKTPQHQAKIWPLLVSAIVNLIILLILGVVSVYSPNLVSQDPAYPTFKETLQTSGLPTILAIISAVAALVTFLLLLRRRNWRWLWISNLLWFLGLLMLVFPPLIPLVDSQQQKPFREIAYKVNQVIQPKEELFLMGYYRYSLVYYSQHQVKFFDDVKYALTYLKESQPSQQNSPTVLIVTQPKFIAKFGLQPQDYELLEQKGPDQLIRVSKSVLLNR